MKFNIITLGCKVNIYESEIMNQKLLANGFIYDKDNADIVIVNTCSVTNMADNKSKKMIRGVRNNNKDAILAEVENTMEREVYITRIISVITLLQRFLKIHTFFPSLLT